MLKVFSFNIYMWFYSKQDSNAEIFQEMFLHFLWRDISKNIFEQLKLFHLSKPNNYFFDRVAQGKQNKDLNHRYFPMASKKSFRIVILQNTCDQLLLKE